jgi:coenzyme F420 hydrogenase subunit beta
MNKSLKSIQKSKLFVGSGVEDILDSNLHTTLDNSGQYAIDYNQSSDDRMSAVVMNSEESRSENEVAQAIFSNIPNIVYSDVIGYHLGLYVGYVVKNSFRKNGSSGGLVSWVAVKLMATGKIDGFIHVKASHRPGSLFEYGISRTVDEIKSGAKSRYYPVELSRVLKEVKKKPGNYAVIGIPEIIMELRLLAENDQVINSRIKYYFGLVCGHQKTTKYAEAIAWEYGIKPGDLSGIDFRIKKNTGTASAYDMKFTGKINNRERTFIVQNNEPFVSKWAHGFFKAKFSDFTDNTFNEVADITFGDAWLSEYEGDPMGNNILILRNIELAKIIKDGIKDGDLKLDMVDEDVIIRSQQGLVHHTRDELPYRLHKEIEINGWAPRKRLTPSNELDKCRKKVQDLRRDIAQKSHLYYEKAVRRGNFEYFKNKMQPYINRYNKAYNQPVPTKPRRSRADGAILTLTGYYNYGNIMQRYALQKFLSKNGYSFISYVDKHSVSRDVYIIDRVVMLKTPLRFIKRLFNHQRPYWHIPSYSDIYPDANKIENIIKFVNKNIKIKPFDPNDKLKNYIVGSDQIWRDWWYDREKLGYYFLNFLKGRKVNRVSYAASFGKDKIHDVIKSEDIEYIKPYIEQFNRISVREKSGIDILKTVWNIDAVQEVVDPTLLLEKSDYSALIDNSDVRHEKIQPIFTYMLGETPEVISFVNKIQNKRHQAITSISAHTGLEDDKLPPVELWLKGFRDAELVVTNSFHGMMFSIINNTDFLIIGRESGGLSRIHDFLSKYDIKGRFIDESDLASFDISKLTNINWTKVNKAIRESKEASGNWLLDSLI